MRYLAKNLKWLREQRGLKQSNIPAAIGFKANTWNNYERSVSKPGLDDLIKISKYFGVTETELLHIDISEKKTASSKKKIDHQESMFKEEEAGYKQMSELKDKIIGDKERIIAAQQGQIEALQLLAEQLKNKTQKAGGGKK